jgi:hypothetical protein
MNALSSQLTPDYGNGFIARNLFQMIRFAEMYPDERIVHALRGQLSWPHVRQIISLSDPLQWEFYKQMNRIERWSTA